MKKTGPEKGQPEKQAGIGGDRTALAQLGVRSGKRFHSIIFKINDSAGELDDNAGRLKVEVRRE